MRRFTVVRLIGRLNVGGPAQHVVHLTAGLAERFPTLLVAGRLGRGEAGMEGLAAEHGVRVLTLALPGREVRPLRDLLALIRLVRLLRRVRPTVVHTHTAKAGAVGRVAAVLAGVPIRVHTFHGHLFHGYFGPVRTRLVLLAERLLARLTTRIVAISPSQARELTRRYRVCPAARVRVVSLGLDLAPFHPERSAPLRAELRRELDPGGDPVVTIVGRLVPIKDHDLFLETARRLVERGRPACFVVVGGGPEEARLRARAAALGLEGRVRFLGWRSDMPRVYAGSDIVVLTSRNEGTPVCLIEALAAGRAVVATEVGGVADLLERGRLGRLVPAGDPDALASALAALLDDAPLRERLGRRGAEVVPIRFGAQRLVADMTTLYEEAIASRGAGAHPFQSGHTSQR